MLTGGCILTLVNSLWCCHTAVCSLVRYSHLMLQLPVDPCAAHSYTCAQFTVTIAYCNIVHVLQSAHLWERWRNVRIGVALIEMLHALLVSSVWPVLAVRQTTMAQMSSQADTNSLIAATVHGKGLKPSQPSSTPSSGLSPASILDEQRMTMPSGPPGYFFITTVITIFHLIKNAIIKVTEWCSPRSMWCSHCSVYVTVRCLPVHPLYCLSIHICHWLQSGHVDESVTGLSLSLHCEHGTGCQQSWSCCGRPLLLSPTENILFYSAYGHWKTDWWLFCDVPSVSQEVAQCNLLQLELQPRRWQQVSIDICFLCWSAAASGQQQCWDLRRINTHLLFMAVIVIFTSVSVLVKCWSQLDMSSTCQNSFSILLWHHMTRIICSIPKITTNACKYTVHQVLHY